METTFTISDSIETEAHVDSSLRMSHVSQLEMLKVLNAVLTRRIVTTPMNCVRLMKRSIFVKKKIMAFPGLSFVLPPYLNRMPLRGIPCFKPQNYGWGKGARYCKKSRW